jgi:hypothetical protein
MGVKVKNNAFTTIPNAITSIDTTMTVKAGDGVKFPILGASDYFYGTLVDINGNLEIVKVTARYDDTMTMVRGQEDTIPIPFPANSRLELRITAATLDEYIIQRGAILLE